MKENYLDLDVYIHFKSKNCQDVSQENGFPLHLLFNFRGHSTLRCTDTTLPEICVKASESRMGIFELHLTRS